MSRLLILLCMVGWALYIVHTNSGRSGDLVAQDTKAAGSADMQAATSTEPQLQSIAAAVVQSPHAIVPDETPRQAPANSSVPPPETETTKAQSEADQGLSPGSSQEPEEQLSVTSETSIRSGPSDSAQLIGRAHAGATLRVKSREAGWVQFVDPVANETGWISMAYLGPTMGNTLQPPKSAKLKTPKPMPKMAKLKVPKPPRPAHVMRHVPPSYAQLPADREFAPPRRGGVFGLFWRRRFSADDGG
jgi:SH3 domain-containing protein